MERDITTLVEPDRVRREVYTDPVIFDLEMRRIHETVRILLRPRDAGAETGRLLRRADRPPADAHGVRQGRTNAQAAYDYVLQVWV